MLEGLLRLRRTLAGSLLVFLMLCLSACTDDAQDSPSLSALERQAQQQGYPVLIATPKVAEYDLPFCEHKYCLEIEIHGLDSNDVWFNQINAYLISEQIRKQLQLTQRMSLQQAVDAFAKQSDLWQQAHPESKPWSLYIGVQVPMQHNQYTLLQLRSEYHLQDIPGREQNYFFMLDRKQRKILNLYDVIQAKARVEFGDYIQHSYQQWKAKFSVEQQYKMPSKLYWATQDWFVDGQDMVIYYRASDLGLPTTDSMQLRLSAAQKAQWLDPEILQHLALQ